MVKLFEEKTKSRKSINREDETFQRFHILLFWRLYELCSNNFKILEFFDFFDQNIIKFLVFEQKFHQILSLFDSLHVGQGLEQVSSKHSGSSIGEAVEVINETVIFVFGLSVDEDLQFRDGLSLDNEQILNDMPFDAERVIIKLGFVVILKIENKRI